ncbi:PTS system mannose/fructose/sorbose family transporter subunit IID [Enterococcus sp. 669A]|uniref:PTS system mannose/fructose/sorbose family transporter subunit IID n=1 Tax=Candidatus Enterococcus moelleringii TaxID=2815325 RepID=A0ABS3L7T1_9ENTE|nr:PTS system mannose/fructose/sorbose family transporter subunit IID [Enterococcus sp. 669A]MBO1305682.1 PTS system mannose/fructose/sorbose family transporter subunit IID [Enterococcus sp. 669A]
MEQKLTQKDLWVMFLRLNTMRIPLNYETLQGVGFLRAISPALEKIYPDKEDLRQAMLRHTVFYNSHVNGDAAILGLTAAMEEATGPDEKEGINPLKTGLMGPLAGLGDSLVKFTWVPIVGSIGASFALSGSIIGPIFMFIMYNVVNIVGRYFAVIYGYRKGIEFLNENQNSDIIHRISTMANVVGLMVVGSLIASVIKVVTPLEIAVKSNVTGDVGGNVIAVQEMLDKIMPSFLSLLVTFIVYRILKKNQGKHAAALIITMMVLTIILKYFGVL